MNKDLISLIAGWAIFAAVVLIGATLSVSIAACDGPNDKYPTYADKQQYFAHYYKDSRTGVCFVGTTPKHLDHDHSHLSVVQCTPDIERLVEDWPTPEN